MKKQQSHTERNIFILLSLLPLPAMLFFYAIAVPLLIMAESQILQVVLAILLAFIFVVLPLYLIIHGIILITKQKITIYASIVVVLGIIWFILLVLLSWLGISA